MSQKELLISQIPQVEVDGSTNIPTALFYESSDQPLIGSAALAAGLEQQRDVNCDFKVDLGHFDSTVKAKQTFRTACGDRKSAQVLTGDFLREVLRHVSRWLAMHGIERGTSVLLAEPLAIHSSPEWLTNYRRNLEEILKNRRFTDIPNIEFSNIDFLPEPFAVFQYYRYGIRHPHVADRKKNQALVIDFGGGTLDVCIIETTRDGDISQSGRNSRPLAASSEAVGGYFINRMIAEHLFRKHVIHPSGSGKLGSMFARGMEIYDKWRLNQHDLSTVAEEYRNFVRCFNQSVLLVENPKISLCKSVTDWGLDAALNIPVSVRLPKNPFTSELEQVDVRLTATELRDIFVREIWEKRIKPIIARTLERGQVELNGAPITVVLLSGGSANIGWLEKLIQKDFAADLTNAEPLHLPDFQEVVSKGLAVECARRFYNKQGDFSAVTYNRLCLLLDPNGIGTKQCRFAPRSPTLPKSDIPGVLLPSASLLQGLIDKPLRWKAHQLGAKPKRLDYYFLRSSFDPQDTENLQNVEHHTVHAPEDCIFNAEIQVELTVKQDGTAVPNFIFRTGQTEEDTVATKGKPFYLDMTYGQTAVSNAYIGLDFGTSNSSVSFVDNTSIQTYQNRAAEKAWNDLGELASTLPYPLAAPLATYLSQSDNARLQRQGREFIEAALAMAAYITYSEFSLNKGRGESSVFKGFTQRSAGPLWRLLRDCLEKLPNTADISTPYRELLNTEIFKLIDDAVTFIAAEKHDKARAGAVDLRKPVEVLANISQKVFARYRFGFFEQVKKQQFATHYIGTFREAAGSPPFIGRWAYKGAECFADQEPFLVNVEKRLALSLLPLLFWQQCPSHPDLDFGHCYLYDIPERQEGNYTFKAVGFPCPCEVTMENSYSSLAERLKELRRRDTEIKFFEIGEFGEVT